MGLGTEFDGYWVVQFFLLRKLIEHELSNAGISEDDAFFCSLSSSTIVYKGQLTPEQASHSILRSLIHRRRQYS